MYCNESVKVSLESCLCCRYCQCTSLLAGSNNQHFSIVSRNVGQGGDSLKEGGEWVLESSYLTAIALWNHVLVIPSLHPPSVFTGTKFVQLDAPTRRPGGGGGCGGGLPLSWPVNRADVSGQLVCHWRDWLLVMPCPQKKMVGAVVVLNQTQHPTSLCRPPLVSRLCRKRSYQCWLHISWKHSPWSSSVQVFCLIYGCIRLCGELLARQLLPLANWPHLSSKHGNADWLEVAFVARKRAVSVCVCVYVSS